MINMSSTRDLNNADPSNSQHVCAKRATTRKARYESRSGGIDTIGVVFRWEDPDDWSTWFERVDLRSRRFRLPKREECPLLGNAARKLRLDIDLPGGIRFGLLPRSSGVWIEGRLAPMLSGDKADNRLMPPKFITEASERVAKDISEICLDLLDFPEDLFSRAEKRVNRLDFSAELCCEPGAGLELLRGLSQLSNSSDRPIRVWSRQGRVENVELRTRAKTGRNIDMRIYDKGAQSRQAPAGTIIRFEREIRWRKSDQPLIEELSNSTLREKWAGAFEPWLGKEFLFGIKPKVFGLSTAADEILKLAESGSLGFQTAERLLGSLVVQEKRGSQWWRDQGHRDAGYRRSKELKGLGITVGQVEDPIDLSDAIRAAMRSLEDKVLYQNNAPERIKPKIVPVPW